MLITCVKKGIPNSHVKQSQMGKMFITKLWQSSLMEPEPELILEYYNAVRLVIKKIPNFLSQDDVDNLTKKIMNGFRDSDLRLITLLSVAFGINLPCANGVTVI